MKSVPLNAFPRSLGRRAGSKKLRESGRVPAVIYGRQTQPQNLEVKSKEIEDLMKRAASESVLIDLAVSEDARPKRLALVQEVQHHPLSGKVLHVDLHEIAENEKVTVSVPVETTGEASGVKNEGGTLEHVLFSVKLRGLPKELPEVLEIDVTNLKLNESIHLGDLKVAEGIEIIGEKTNPVVTIAAPRVEEEAAPAEAAAPGEVAMIKEKKEEGEAGAAPAGDKKAAAPAAGEKKAAAGEKKAAGGEKKAAAPAAKK